MSGTQAELTGFSVISLSERFVELAERFCGLLRDEGFNVLPYQNSTDLSFNKLPEEKQSQIISHFEIYVDVCSDTVEQGHSLKESKFLLWNMLQKLGLTPSSDLFDKIKDEQIFEIYNEDNVQIFRNLNFFTICSHSIDDLVSTPWWSLFRRDDSVSREIFNLGSTFLSGTPGKTLRPDIKTHLLEEIGSSGMLRMLVDIEVMSPLRSQYSKICCFVAENAKLIQN